MDSRVPGQAYTSNRPEDHVGAISDWMMQRVESPAPLTKDDFAGLSPADIVWMVHAQQQSMALAQNAAEAQAYSRQVPALPGDVAPVPEGGTQRPMLEADHPDASRAWMQGYGEQGNGDWRNADKLAPYQAQYDVITKAMQRPEGTPVVIPHAAQTEPDIVMTIAGQLEARRRALGGAVSPMSPWNTDQSVY